MPAGRSESGSRGRGLITPLSGGSGGYARPALRPVLRGNSLDLGTGQMRVTPDDAGSHMWTAPGLQDLAQRTDRSDCDHMSGLLSRSHMTAAKMGAATRVPNRKATFAEGHWDSRSVSRLGIESITPSAPSRASFGLNSRAPVRLPVKMLCGDTRRLCRCPMIAVVGLAADHQLPGDPRRLVGERHGRKLRRLALDERHEPGRGVAPRLADLLDYRGGTAHQGAAQCLITSARDDPEPLLAGGGVVLRG